MAASASGDELAVPGERFFTLSDGRTLAFCSGGSSSSSKVAVMLHGVFGVGAMEGHVSRVFESLGWRVLAPTLPGWGRSSDFPAGAPVSAYASDIQELLAREVGTPTHILVFGGSYGSIWAYAVAANRPPAGKPRIAPEGALRGLCVLGGFSPYADEDGYAAALQGMTTMNWLTVGRPGRSVFLRWIHPLVGRLMRSKLSGGLQSGVDLIRQILTGPGAMTPAERAEIEAWAASAGTTFDAWEASMGRNCALSVREGLGGYDATPAVINGEWGFKLQDIKLPGSAAESRPELTLSGPAEVPARLPPVVIGGCLRDHLAPIAMQRFVASKIPGAQMVALQGNHISAVTCLLPLITAMIRGLDES